MAKFRLKSPFKKQRSAAAALPPSTSRPTNAAEPGADSAKKKPKKAKGPGGLEVTTATATSSGGPATHDEVSVMTPVTGIPPDSPDRHRNLPSLLPPRPPPPQPMGQHLYSGTYSPPSTPSRGGGMDINVHHHEPGGDDISVMTPVTGVVSPEKKERKAAYQQPQQTQERQRQQNQRLAPPQVLLDDDDESKELTVFEDDEPGAGVGYRSASPINITLVPTKNGRRPTPPTKEEWEPKSSTKKVKEGYDAATAKLIRSKRSWLTNTGYFQRVIDSSFDMIDVDKSGDVDVEELYAGLLLIHLKMAMYVGAPACRVGAVCVHDLVLCSLLQFMHPFSHWISVVCKSTFLLK